VLPHGHTRVRCSQVDADRRPVALRGSHRSAVFTVREAELY
jgi:hypothetical protein